MGRGAGARRAAGRVGLDVALLLLVLIAGLWLARKPIATDVIDHYAAKRGVPLRYRVEQLGPGRQRLADVVIGDPRAPDIIADWIETGTRLGLDGVHVVTLRAGHVRARGRWTDGRLSLGSIDRLLPSSGASRGLPAYDIDVSDARLQLATPAGAVMVRLSGSGRLDGGFSGTLAAASPVLAAAGFAAQVARADGTLSVAHGQPRWRGRFGAETARSGTTLASGIAGTADVTLGAALDRWHGQVALAADRLRSGTIGLLSPQVEAGFAGDAQATTGRARVLAGAATAPQGSAGSLGWAGTFAIGRAGVRLAGRAQAHDARLAEPLLRTLGGLDRATTATPVAPLARRLATTLETAGRRFDLAANMSLAGATATVATAQLRADNGVLATLTGPVTVGPAGVAATATRVTLGGGELPRTVLTATRDAQSGRIAGVVTVAPFAADGAALALTPLRFALAPGDDLTLNGAARITGPLGAAGHVVALTGPITVRRSGGAWLVDPACATWRAAAVTLGSLRLQDMAIPICPLDGALVRWSGDRLGGGARLGRTALAGQLGSSAFRLSAAGATLTLADRRFAVDRLAIRIGPDDRPTLIDVATLTGTATRTDVSGRLAGGGGQIGAVPLLLSDAAGDWRFAGGRLTLDGGLTVSDTQTAAPRFKPLPAKDVRLALVDGRIAASGTLVAPGDAARTIATVAIAHDLSRGTGHADLTVPSLVFDKALQPDQLTPLTLGVIADVVGTVTGEGHLAWSPAGVTSTGVFRTSGTDLAAAFGPVTGLATEIRFTDLLALESAPHQRATVASLNPGIPVSDGVIGYQTLPGSRIKVEQALWPFAGGTLKLEPTTLDLGGASAKRLTFTLTDVKARQFLAQFDFKNLDASGTFDGTLPMVFDADGGRIEHGELQARAGGGTIAYVGPVSEKDLGVWGNLAFQALKSLNYRSVHIAMDGPLAGEMVTEVRFAGVSQGVGAKSNFLIRRLQKLPFVFNVRIKAPFRGLIDSAQSFFDPSRLVARNLPALLREQDGAPPPTPVQPPASEPKP